MPLQDPPRPRHSLNLAIALSVLLHGLVLFVPTHAPRTEKPAARLEARLAPPTPLAPTEVVPKPQPPAPRPTPARRPVLAVAKGKGRSVAPQPKWTVAQKQEMDSFLDELNTQAKTRPNLAQRALAAARDFGRQQASQEDEGSAILERLPNSPPVDPFSLEMYLDALVKKLNRSAAFVKNDPRTKGVKNAAVQVRLNPDGSLKSFRILNAGDQKDEIAFIKSVVEQSVPFSPFPRDLKQSAGSLSMVICIQPGNGGGGFGFTRMPGGHSC